MQKIYHYFSKEIDKFREEIYFFCDYNVDSKVLFPLFRELWPEFNSKSRKKDILNRDLARVTSNILDELIDKKILEIVDKEALNGYAFYRILPHKDLLDHANFVDKKRALKFK